MEASSQLKTQIHLLQHTRTHAPIRKNQMGGNFYIYLDLYGQNHYGVHHGPHHVKGGHGWVLKTNWNLPQDNCSQTIELLFLFQKNFLRRAQEHPLGHHGPPYAVTLPKLTVPAVNNLTPYSNSTFQSVFTLPATDAQVQVLQPVTYFGTYCKVILPCLSDYIHFYTGRLQPMLTSVVSSTVWKTEGI